MNYLKSFSSKTFNVDLNNEYFIFMYPKSQEILSNNEFLEYLNFLSQKIEKLSLNNLKVILVLPHWYFSWEFETEESANLVTENDKLLRTWLKNLISLGNVQIKQIVNFNTLNFLAYTISKQNTRANDILNTEGLLDRSLDLAFNDNTKDKEAIANYGLKEDQTNMYWNLFMVYSFFSNNYNVSGIVFEELDVYLKSIPKNIIIKEIDFLNRVFNYFKQELKIKIYSYCKKNIKLKYFNLLNFIDEKIYDFEFKNNFALNLFDTILLNKASYNLNFNNYLNIKHTEYVFMLEKLKTIAKQLIFNNPKISFTYLPNIFLSKWKAKGVLYHFNFLDYLYDFIIDQIIYLNTKYIIANNTQIKNRYLLQNLHKGILCWQLSIDNQIFLEKINISNKVYRESNFLLMPYQTKLIKKRD
ncbi:hypothetical protein CO229_01520 [Mycoplasmopsis bovirhinis]|uniref:hypothetical protein n=1 Tax=Mycoplasmopsis bovirhinis TaxID=29553 RepID=UPI000C05A9D5|nr:hypothetical protein [Mycoplasmopsis bovirhinis]ATO30795.1 hypothetical protein CO229_01520 [Mycoplasmopsis bovirhinis]